MSALRLCGRSLAAKNFLTFFDGPDAAGYDSG
jgi:hypothetical protein